jgi:hypothetical protein
VRAMPPRYSLDIPRTTEKVQRANIAANASRRSWGGRRWRRDGHSGRRVRPIHRPWPFIAPALWAGVAGGIPPSSSCVRLGGRLRAGGRWGNYEPDGRRGDLEEREGVGGPAPPPRPIRPRLHPACAGPRPMKWASEAGAGTGERDRRLWVGPRGTPNTWSPAVPRNTRPASWAAKCRSALYVAVRFPGPCRFGGFIPGPRSRPACLGQVAAVKPLST